MSLSSSHEQLADRYDVVVIGSGYGASVCAARLAASADVCVLERGKEYAAGQFPGTAAEMLRESQFQDALGHQGNRLGLFEFHLNRDLDLLVGCGLGGTSLINGGIAIEPDPAVLEQPSWPREITWPVLAPYAERARRVLRPAQYPGDWPTPAKLSTLQRASAVVPNSTFSRVAIGVHFGREGETAPGVVQRACNNCGDCVTGCNFDAKNGLTHTYLPLAHAAGASIFTQCEVLHVAREGGGYRVHVRLLDAAGGPPVQRSVAARAVIVGAGVLGSTSLLLRSASADLRFSDLLGRRFSGNGDAISIGYNTDHRTDVLGVGPTAIAGKVDPIVGATLLGVIDARAGRPLPEAIIVEEGAIPSALVRVLAPVVQLAAAGAGETRGGVLHWLRERQREALDLVGRTDDGAMNHSMLFLSMGHDDSGGRISLDGDGRPRIEWPTLKDAPVFRVAEEIARAITKELGGIYVQDPLWSNPLLKSNVSVHPLGGCAMGAGVEEGVVDHLGRVYDRERGGVHEGLYVTDASIVPTSLGVNPLLTITALAERIAENVAREVR